MEKRKLNQSIIFIIGSGIMLVLTIITMYYTNKPNQELKDDDFTYVSKLFPENIESVVNTNETLIRPYSNPEIKIIQNYYDYKGKESDQENSIINYDTTYLQNNAIAYGGIKDKFNVLSVLDGTVTSIKEDKLLGKVVTITHQNNITTVYKSLSEVNVKENDKVVQGNVIGKAGESNINTKLGNHVSFEILKDGQYLNPENCYETEVSKLGN